MENVELTKIRNYLGKTQKQLAQLLCVSPKAIQSFEQGWRHIPDYIEREILLLLALKASDNTGIKSCWDIKHCSKEWRENCIVWELKLNKFCWFINGTCCHGQTYKNWSEKIKECQKCEIFKTATQNI